LPAALKGFSGFCARYPKYILTNPNHIFWRWHYRSCGIDFHRVGSAPVATPLAG
jgi:hypothetical protein